MTESHFCATTGTEVIVETRCLSGVISDHFRANVDFKGIVDEEWKPKSLLERSAAKQ
jgi:hypothetical protein